MSEISESGTLGSDSEQVLSVICRSGHWPRLERESKRLLEINPNDLTAHYYLAVSLIFQQNLDAGWEATRRLLQQAPEGFRSHLAAVFAHQEAGDWSKMRDQAMEGVGLFPDSAMFFFYAALACKHLSSYPQARKLIRRARELSPNDVSIINQDIRLHAQEGVADAWRRIDEYQRALPQEPNSAELHEGLADIYLYYLDMPREAATHYRESLRAEPQNKELQQKLFDAVSRRDLLYRLLSIPSRVFTDLSRGGSKVRQNPFVILLFPVVLIVCWPALVLSAVWLVIVTATLWPVGRFYEWLLVSEIQRPHQKSSHFLKWWFYVQRWPRLLRLSGFLVVALIFWACLFKAVGVPLQIGFCVLGLIIGVHTIFIVGLYVLRRGSAVKGRWMAQRRGQLTGTTAQASHSSRMLS